MKLELLHMLRCPFCGGALALSDSPRPNRSGSDLALGILECDCCAYPVVAGIPYLQANQLARTVLRHLHGGDSLACFQCLAGLDASRRADLAALLRGEPSWTFRRALSLFCPGPEADYFFYRHSDPTYLVGEGMVTALGEAWPVTGGLVLDLCGGTGHLTRLLGRVHSQAGILLADRDFWKLWLARRFMAPRCEAICCDAAQPLPLARAQFQWVVCSDAMNYIWPRRLLVSEMSRLLVSGGLILVLHMHNAMVENPSEGMPLKPATFRGLFESLPVRLFAERALLDSLLEDRSLRLAVPSSDSDLTGEPAYGGVATERASVFRDYEDVPQPGQPGFWRRNPLYEPDPAGSATRFKRRFPSAFYEAENAVSKRYLPESVTFDPEDLARWNGGMVSETMERLVAQRVLLDLPENYG